MLDKIAVLLSVVAGVVFIIMGNYFAAAWAGIAMLAQLHVLQLKKD